MRALKCASRIVSGVATSLPVGQIVFSVREEAQGPALPILASVRVGIIVVGAIEGAYCFGDVMARIGYGEGVGMATPACKAAANIARPR